MKQKLIDIWHCAKIAVIVALGATCFSAGLVLPCVGLSYIFERIFG